MLPFPTVGSRDKTMPNSGFSGRIDLISGCASVSHLFELASFELAVAEFFSFYRQN